MLPITPRVHALLTARWEAAGKPSAGWVFPNGGKFGHFSEDVAKDQHKKALDDSRVEAFVPKCSGLRL